MGGNTGIVIFTLTGTAGFGSVVNFLCQAYIYAKETQQPFYIEHDNWQSTYKDGWHDYFKTLTYYDPTKKGTNITRFKHASMGSTPNYSLAQYRDCIQEIFILNDDLVKRSQDFIGSIGGQYKSLYLRRGDKIDEGPHKNITDILAATDISDEDNLFIQTDDYRVIDEIKALKPLVRIYTMTPASADGSYHSKNVALSPEKKRENFEELFISMYVFLKGIRGFSDNNSNMGRFLKMASPETVTLYPIEEGVTLDTIINPGFHSISATKA